MTALARLNTASSRGAAEVQNAASMKGLPVALVAALVMVESAGRESAWRFEAPYRYYWDVRAVKPFREPTAAERAGERAPADFAALPDISSRDTEWAGQACSWGPLQVMGAVTREYGYLGAFPALCSWGVGLEYGLLHLTRLRNRFLDKYTWAGVVAAYNAGSPRRIDGGLDWVNQDYVNRVRAMGGFEGLDA